MRENPADHEGRNARLHPLLKWMRVAGVGAELFGWGGLMLADEFWPAVFLIYCGFVILVLDLWFEPELNRKWRIGIGALLLVLMAVFSVGFVFVKSPLDVSAIMVDAEYPAGTTVAGIAWRPQFTEVDVLFQNPSDSAYDDVSILLRPSTAVAGIGQLTNLPGISWDDKDGMIVRLMDIDLRTRRSSILPLKLLATDAGYTILCQHLPAKAPLTIVLALADIKWNPKPPDERPVQERARDNDFILRLKDDVFGTYWEGHPDADVWATRPTSGEWMKIEGTYFSRHRQRFVSEHLPIGPGSPTPKTP
jgi:hypothetical protein